VLYQNATRRRYAGRLCDRRTPETSSATAGSKMFLGQCRRYRRDPTYPHTCGALLTLDQKSPGERTLRPPTPRASASQRALAGQPSKCKSDFGLAGVACCVCRLLTEFGVRIFQDLTYGRRRMSHLRTLVPRKRTRRICGYATHFHRQP
jgi:hypothetical protein